MRSTFKILFYLKKNSPKRNGYVPVMCRVTIDGTIAQFSCKLDVDPSSWNVTTARVSGRSNIALDANRFLDKIRVGVNKHYQDIADRESYVTAEKVKNSFLGLGMKCELLLDIFRLHNEDFAKQVGKMKSLATYQKYRIVYGHLEEFIKQRYNVSDMAIRELKPTFITDFELFLRTDKKSANNTVWLYMMPLRRMVAIAQRRGWVQRDPFVDYSISKESVDRGYLTKEELRLLMTTELPRKKDELIRDLFVFCCFTGLSYRDMYNLSHDNLQTSFDGHLWIMTKRQKTGAQCNIRLLDVPKKIIEKYQGVTSDDKILPSLSYSICNRIIKKIIKLCGIDKHVTWHVSRHTFATECCLTNGVPIETVSKMLGHTNIKTTQIYAKITNEKVSNDMEALSQKLKGLENFICQTL